MKKKILIVEDDAFLLDAYQMKMTGQTDWDVSVATDGEAALFSVKSTKPDLVILDLLLPKKPGLDVLKELKADADTKKIPIIVASNIDQKTVVQQAIDLGAADYFVKSDISIGDLIKKCQAYL